jgi:hypothetical protein
MRGVDGKFIIKCLRAKTKHTKTPVLAIFFSTNDKCKSIPKPPYLKGIVTYEDGRMVSFHSNFT